MGDLRLLRTLAAVTVLYFLAGWLGLQFAHANASVSAVWPASGIAVASLLVVGMRAWPAVALGAFLTNLSIQGDAGSSMAIAAGNTLEGVVGAALTARFARGRFAFDRGADMLRFAAFAALAATIAATVGVSTLRASALAPGTDTWLLWWTWWLGDATGVVLVAPLCVLSTVRQPPIRATRGEAVALGASVAAVIVLVLTAPALALRDLPLAMLMLPILLWAAFRFNTRTTAAMSVVLSAIVIYRAQTADTAVPLDPTVSLPVVQCLAAIVTLLVLPVAAEVSTRARVEAQVRLLNDELERRVRERTRELTRVHDRLAQAQAVAHVGSWEWDVVTDAIWWSDELCRIFGVAQPPPVYRDVLTLVHPDDRDRVDAAARESAGTGQPFALDLRIVRPDGWQRVLHVIGRVELGEDARPVRVLGIGHDITERLQAEEARAQLTREQMRRREVEVANSAKDAFLATLSHELRTPLNAALGWAHILRDSLRSEGREGRAVEAIYRNLMLQSHLVSDILDISRIVKGELPLERTIVDMVAVFDTALDMVRESAAARGVTVDLSAAGSTTVIGDTRRLQQVATNLLSNAVKFAAEGGRVTVSIREAPQTVECAVEDDGPGIAPEFLPHVFEQFRQADSSMTRAHGGLGLGLAIAHEIVARHNGTISAGNRATGGARFVVRLPQWAAEPFVDRRRAPMTRRS